MKEKEFRKENDIQAIGDDKLVSATGGNYVPDMSRGIKTSDLVYRQGQTEIELTTLPATAGTAASAINLSDKGKGSSSKSSAQKAVKREIL